MSTILYMKRTEKEWVNSQSYLDNIMDRKATEDIIKKTQKNRKYLYNAIRSSIVLAVISLPFLIKGLLDPKNSITTSFFALLFAHSLVVNILFIRIVLKFSEGSYKMTYRAKLYHFLNATDRMSRIDQKRKTEGLE